MLNSNKNNNTNESYEFWNVQLSLNYIPEVTQFFKCFSNSRISTQFEIRHTVDVNIK